MHTMLIDISEKIESSKLMFYLSNDDLLQLV